MGDECLEFVRFPNVVLIREGDQIPSCRSERTREVAGNTQWLLSRENDPCRAALARSPVLELRDYVEG